jgi:hypothetical protein
MLGVVRCYGLLRVEPRFDIAVGSIGAVDSQQLVVAITNCSKMVIEASRGVPRTSKSDLIERFELERVIENGSERRAEVTAWSARLV